MAGMLPELASGAKVVRDTAGTCFSPVGVQYAYCPPAGFTASCDLTALPSDCTARITPAQINGIVSEILAFAYALNPTGSWQCGSTSNLANAFAAFKADSGKMDGITITGSGTVADPYAVDMSGFAAAMCGDAAALDDLAACISGAISSNATTLKLLAASLISTDAGNLLVVGNDDLLYVAASGAPQPIITGRI